MQGPRAETSVRSDRTGQLLLIGGGLLAFTMLGWTGLVVPSLIREIQRDLAVNDADMGIAYGVFMAMFLAGCLLTGWATSRTGRRPLLLGALTVMFLGTVAALVPSWPVFIAAGALRGLGSGMLEVGIQGLFLAAFTGALQGRAINSVHFTYSLGAVIAPIAMAALVGLGIVWTDAMALAAIPIAIAGVMLALAPIEGAPTRSAGPSVRLRATIPLVAAGLAIACYVAAEVGVSSWLVRFLADVDLALAASALTLFWVALAASRLVVARFGHRVPPETLVGVVLVARLRYQLLRLVQVAAGDEHADAVCELPLRRLAPDVASRNPGRDAVGRKHPDDQLSLDGGGHHRSDPGLVHRGTTMCLTSAM